MLEAVNSVLSNAQYMRAAAEQQSVLNSFAANPDRVQQVPTVAPYLSLYIKVDNNFDKAILQIRDNQSGDVLRQIPTESQLEAYRRAQTSNAVRSSEPMQAKDLFANTPEEVTPQQTSSPTPSPTYVPETPNAPAAPPPVSVDTQA